MAEGARERRTSLIAAAVALAALLHAGGAGAEVIDRVVASVNNNVITLSDLRAAVAFNASLGGKPVTRQMAAETLEGLINRRLLLEEAARLHFAEVSDQDIAAEEERLRGRFASAEAYRAFLERAGMTEERVRQALGERLTVERFVERKVELYARVTRADAEAYFREHVEEFKGRRFVEVQKRITAMLSARSAAQQLDAYVAELRARADIRTNALRERDGF